MASVRQLLAAVVLLAAQLLGSIVSGQMHEGPPLAEVGPAEWEEAFREYLRLPSVHPTPNYNATVQFLLNLNQKYLGGLLRSQVRTYAAGKPSVLFTWPGHDSTLGGVMLVSHMDVVPVEADRWIVDPFSGYKDAEGRIYGRGAQDDKGLAIQYLAAIHSLAKDGFVPHRTIYLMFSVDEEIGGQEGLGSWFADKAVWDPLNVGFILDEGLPSEGEEFFLFYAERLNWWIDLTAHGPNGHGSLLLPHTAVEQLQSVLSHFHTWRAEEEAKLVRGEAKSLGEVITVNVNMLQAGVFSSDYSSYSTNTIPGEAKAAIDLRFPPSVDLVRVEALLRAWAAAGNVSLHFQVGPYLTNYVTSTDAVDNPWWNALKLALAQGDYQTEARVFPAGTDSARFRRAGIPAVGFSPIRRTPNRMHADNEYLASSVFREGISIYEAMVAQLALVIADPTADQRTKLLSLVPTNYPLPGDLSPPAPSPEEAAGGMSYKAIAAIVGVVVLLAVASVLGVAKYRSRVTDPQQTYSQLNADRERRGEEKAAREPSQRPEDDTAIPLADIAPAASTDDSPHSSNNAHSDVFV